MVYLVVLQGNPEAVAAAKQTLIASSDGWKVLGDGVLLVGQEQAGSLALRNFIGRQSDVGVAVVPLGASWAAQGCVDLVEWLNAARRLF